MDTNFGQLFLKGGWVMWPLLVFSIITWAIVLERTIVFLSLRPKISRLSNALLQSLRKGDFNTAKQLCHHHKAQVSDVFLGAIDTQSTKEHAERATERNKTRLIQYFKRNLWILGTIGSASPFIGLLGTVVGIVKAFHDMAEKGAGGFSVVAGGISEALIATAGGLIVAIVALITYNIFVTAANQTVNSIKLNLDELLELSFDTHKTKA